jgi:hypothetical protein
MFAAIRRTLSRVSPVEIEAANRNRIMIVVLS